MKVPIRSFAKRLDITDRPESELLSVYRDHGVVPKSSRDDNFNKPSEDLSTYRYVRPGNLVLNKMKTWQGSLAVSEFEGIVSPAYFVCELSHSVHPRYIHHLLRSDPLIAEYGARSKGIRPNQWDLPYDDFKTIEVDLPPIEEQRRIADFLDDQVGRIDHAIALRKEQGKLIKSQIQSLITETVTGRDNSHPSTSSKTVAMTQGALIDIHLPEGWEWAPLGFLAPRVSNTGWGDLEPLSVYLGAGVVRRADRDDNRNVLGADMDKYLHVLPGDLVFNKLRTWQGGLGASKYEGIVSPAYYVLRCGSRLESRYANYVLLSSPYLSELTRLSKFMPPSQFDMPWEALMRLPMLVPPLGEQRRIADFLDAQVEVRQNGIGHLVSGIGLLEERKRSLITAAVTGQLNVLTAESVGMTL